MKSYHVFRFAFFSFLFSLFILTGCGTVERPAKPSATGKAGELLVVMPAGSWDGAVGKSTKDVFKQLEPMFLQPEPLFDLVQIDDNKFVSLFETHRHIFIVEVDPELPRASIDINRDVWSHPQMVIRIKTPNDSIFQLVMERNSEAFIGHYLAIEKERNVNAYKRMLNQQAIGEVQEMFGIDMAVPEGYYVAEKTDQFIWLRRTGTRQDLEMGVLIAALPYNDPAIDFAHETISSRRDSLTKLYIPGQFEGSYMTTYPELTPEFREINFNGRYAIEARSLWRVEGDFMGGPFVNYTMVDEHTSRLFIFDGFVYAPNFDKRDYLRQLMALIFSVEFPEKEEVAAD